MVDAMLELEEELRSFVGNQARLLEALRHVAGTDADWLSAVPADLWTCTWISALAAAVGLGSLEQAAARRGLLLSEREGDAKGLRAQLQRSLAEPMRPEHEAAPRSVEALADLERALHGDLEGGTHLSPLELCRALIPGFDGVRVKRGWEDEEVLPLE